MQAARAPLVYFVILNWNQQQLTLDCLDSLAKVEYPNLEVILVDNGSTDGSAEAIRSRYPSVIVIENGENLGFSEGNNVGMRYALAHGADYVLLLNNDTVVDPGFVAEMIAVAEADPSCGIVGPKMYYHDEPSVIWCAGNAIAWSSGCTSRLQAEQQDMHPEVEPPREVDFITACAMAVKRSVIDEIGLLDPRYFIYYDETDWCVRAAAKGFKVVYVPSSRIWHKVSAAMGTASPATDYYMTRDGLLFFSTRAPGISRVLAPARIVLRTIRTIAAWTLRPRYRSDPVFRRKRDANLLALRDFFLRRFGKMGPDVAAVCYGER
jgi:hypothetical protein